MTFQNVASITDNSRPCGVINNPKTFIKNPLTLDRFCNLSSMRSPLEYIYLFFRDEYQTLKSILDGFRARCAQDFRRFLQDEVKILKDFSVFVTDIADK